MNTLEIILFTITGLAVIFSTGIFLAFSLAINKALAQTNDTTYLDVMQRINTVIQNASFLTLFMIPVLLLPILTLLYGEGFMSLRFILLASASLLYIFGMFGITVGGNVPLNDMLAKQDLTQLSAEQQRKIRQQYEKPWNRLHTTRTILGVISSGMLLVAYAL